MKFKKIISQSWNTIIIISAVIVIINASTSIYHFIFDETPYINIKYTKIQCFEEEFKYILNDFVVDCEEYQWSTNILKHRILSIKYSDKIEEGSLGLTKTYYCKEDRKYYYRIFISPEIKNKATILKSVIYHEIGHAYGRKHTDRYFSLMYKEIDITKVDYEVFYTLYWDFTKHCFFTMNDNYTYKEFEAYSKQVAIYKLKESIKKTDNINIIEKFTLYEEFISDTTNLKSIY